MRKVLAIGSVISLACGATGMGEPAGGRCAVRWLTEAEVAELGREVIGREAEAPVTGGFQIILNAGVTLAGNAAALAAWELAVAELEGLISDPVTVTISADLASLNPGVIGSTGLTPWLAPYDTVRDAMAADGGADESELLDMLPTFAELNVLLPPGYSLNTNVFFATSNCRALGLDCPAIADAAITFSTNFPFDFDPSDGIAFNKIDFVGVAMHEMMHALGFISIVDSVDINLFLGQPPVVVPPTPLDLLRLEVGAGTADFTSATRLLAPGALTDAHACYDGSVDLRFSEGLFNGDGRQASHWRDDALSPFFLYGLMDPNIAFGVRGEVSDRDIRALDLIGWDIVSQADPDCNANGWPDAQDLAVGGSGDCNDNVVPDECDIASGSSGDCDGDAVPDDCVLGDVNGDGDVDLGDYAGFVTCRTAPGGGPLTPGCDVFDADCDDDVDLLDFGTFQSLFTGP